MVIRVKQKKEKSVAGFFDVDETLINQKSMFSFFDYWVAENNLVDLNNKYQSSFRTAREQNQSREKLNQMYYQFFAGESLSKIVCAGELWFKKCLSSGEFFIEETLEHLYMHQNNGDRVVFVSGSMLPLLRPIAKYLNVNDVLCNELIIDKHGILTGQIGKIQTIGKGKSVSIKLFALENNINLHKSFAYGDDVSDIHMLLAVGNPVYFGVKCEMVKYAKDNGLPVPNIIDINS